MNDILAARKAIQKKIDILAMAVKNLDKIIAQDEVNTPKEKTKSVKPKKIHRSFFGRGRRLMSEEIRVSALKALNEMVSEKAYGSVSNLSRKIGFVTSSNIWSIRNTGHMSERSADAILKIYREYRSKDFVNVG
ncbi:MAG: hypothetical protein ACYDBV_14145 [Nitrospiria bacterium]